MKKPRIYKRIDWTVEIDGYRFVCYGGWLHAVGFLCELYRDGFVFDIRQWQAVRW